MQDEAPQEPALVNDPVSLVKEQPKPSKRKPTKSLPTNRVAFPKQLDVTRAYAIASGDAGDKVVKTSQVAEVVGIHTTTVQLVNPFLSEAKLITKVEGGGYLPSPEVLAFNQAHAWTPDAAAEKLGPVLARTWFAQALIPKLRLHPMETNEAITLLAEAANADPEYRSQLAMILEYMDAGGLIVREGTTVRVRGGGPSAAATESAAAEVQAQPPVERREVAKTATSVSTTFAKDAAEGVVAFNVSVRVNLTEFAGWSPARISSFFNGIATVLNAKSQIEDAPGVDSD